MGHEVVSPFLISYTIQCNAVQFNAMHRTAGQCNAMKRNTIRGAVVKGMGGGDCNPRRWSSKRYRDSTMHGRGGVSLRR